MNDQAVGIVDEPNRGDQPEKLDIGRHAVALAHFIQKADTSFTSWENSRRQING